MLTRDKLAEAFDDKLRRLPLPRDRAPTSARVLAGQLLCWVHSRPAGLALLSAIGADRVIWSADFPHHESSYGFSWSMIQEVMEATMTQDARMILGGTAMKLFGLE